MKLLLLHGAIGSSGQLQPLADILKSKYDVSLLNFSGHGGNVGPDYFSIELFAKDVLNWMKNNSVEKIDVFGYSMGGYVALYLARHFPEKINRIFTLATKFNWTPESASSEIKMLNPETITEKLPNFALTLQERHAPRDWKKIMTMTTDMMMSMGNKNVLSKEDFQSIDHEIILSVGDNDKMVSIDETENVSNLLWNSKMIVLKDTKHSIEGVDVEVLSGKIIGFWQNQEA
jgi:esterase/lipase